MVALPWVTVGFYSKDEILLEAYAANHPELFYAGLAGAFMTAIYTFRLIFVAFHGEEKTHAHAIHGWDYWLPLGILLVLSTGLGALIAPPLDSVLPKSHEAEAGVKHLVEIMTIATAVIGTALATFLFLFDTKIVKGIANSSIGKVLTKWWYAAWGFDWLYDMIFVKPFLFLVRLVRRDPIDQTFNLIPAGVQQAIARLEPPRGRNR